jgi:hypothetical protein
MERKLKLPAVPNLKLGRKVVKEKYEEVSKVSFATMRQNLVNTNISPS